MTHCPAPMQMPTTVSLPFLNPVAAFLEGVGLRVEWGGLTAAPFLPGLQVVRGGLRVDVHQLQSAGDLLHEGGHLAGMTAKEREQQVPIVSADGGLEMMAIAWSYAAAVYIELPLDVLFHTDGYKGSSASLIDNFSNGRFIGVPMLQYHGMAFEPRMAAEHRLPPYPHMHRWLRQ